MMMSKIKKSAGEKVKDTVIQKKAKLHPDVNSATPPPSPPKSFKPFRTRFGEDKIPEVAPPGKEKVVKALKKKWPDNLKRVYATAWWQYNKEKGKND